MAIWKARLWDDGGNTDYLLSTDVPADRKAVEAIKVIVELRKRVAGLELELSKYR